jgi:Ca2+-binding RTX toxin-like protein
MAPADPNDGRRKRRRRTAILLGAMLLMVMVAAGVALAVNKTCNDNPGNGTENDDVLYERVGNGLGDTIYGFEGADAIDANTFRKDRDRIFGGPGSDRLLANDGDNRNTVRGSDGRDVCYVDSGDRVTGCESVRGENRSETENFDLSASAF